MVMPGTYSQSLRHEEMLVADRVIFGATQAAIRPNPIVAPRDKW